jgi:predicted HAD superfamily Cof-like phosphohydrolase
MIELYCKNKPCIVKLIQHTGGYSCKSCGARYDIHGNMISPYIEAPYMPKHTMLHRQNSMQCDVQNFHQKFELLINDKPTLPSEQVRELRKKLIIEETEEIFKGMDDGDMVEIADGLADLLYVVFGLAVSYGINAQTIFDEVHRSNMTKIWSDGTVHKNKHGKVIKPDTYSKADIGKVLKDLGYEKI